MLDRKCLGARKAWSAFVVALAGCAAFPPGSIDPRSIRIAGEFGPTATRSPRGTLRIETATHKVAYGEHGIYAVHEGYDVYDEQGRLIERVENHRWPGDERVEDVHLDAGRYFVAVPDGAVPKLWIGIEIRDGLVTQADVTRLSKPPATSG